MSWWCLEATPLSLDDASELVKLSIMKKCIQARGVYACIRQRGLMRGTFIVALILTTPRPRLSLNQNQVAPKSCGADTAHSHGLPYQSCLNQVRVCRPDQANL